MKLGDGALAFRIKGGEADYLAALVLDAERHLEGRGEDVDDGAAGRHLADLLYVSALVVAVLS